MTFTDPGVLGAKRATYRGTNPRPLLKQIMEKSKDEKVWRDTFWTDVEDDKDYLRAIVDYWLDNNIRSILMENSPESATARGQNAQKARQKTKQTTEQVKQAVQTRVRQEAKIILLQMIMPNGKHLGDCTGNDCRHFGGWYAALAKKIPPNATVAATMSEREVVALWHNKSR
jgi:hypothetical protein